MRRLAVLVGLLVVCSGAAAATTPGGKLAYRDGNRIVVLDLGTGDRQAVAAPNAGRPRLSGDGNLLSVGGTIVDNSGRVLWWPDPQGSASIMADGLELYADRVPLFETLAYSDYVTPCGSRLAVAAGGDRYAMHGKRIMLDGRDLSRDATRSWVSPSCSADGRTVVAAASRNAVPNMIGDEHRSIWQLLPSRRRSTPPAGWTDEYPRVLADRAVLFVRSRTTSRRVDGAWRSTQPDFVSVAQ